MNARDRIALWFQKFEQPAAQLTREDVTFLVIQARQLIETSGVRERYRLISFYADWTVHTALDRSQVCFEVLRDITRVIADNFTYTSPDMTQQISRVIGLPQLRVELVSLFRENGLSVALFEYYQNWRGFLSHLLWSLEGKRIAFPSDPGSHAKRIRDEMLGIQRPHNITVEALAVVNVQGTYNWVLDISGDKEIKMVGAINLAEPESDFTVPPELRQ
jgi:hypothetical protein